MKKPSHTCPIPHMLHATQPGRESVVTNPFHFPQVNSIQTLLDTQTSHTANETSDFIQASSLQHTYPTQRQTSIKEGWKVCITIAGARQEESFLTHTAAAPPQCLRVETGQHQWSSCKAHNSSTSVVKSDWQTPSNYQSHKHARTERKWPVSYTHLTLPTSSYV